MRQWRTSLAISRNGQANLLTLASRIALFEAKSCDRLLCSDRLRAPAAERWVVGVGADVGEETQQRDRHFVSPTSTAETTINLYRCQLPWWKRPSETQQRDRRFISPRHEANRGNGVPSCAKCPASFFLNCLAPLTRCLIFVIKLLCKIFTLLYTFSHLRTLMSSRRRTEHCQSDTTPTATSETKILQRSGCRT